MNKRNKVAISLLVVLAGLLWFWFQHTSSVPRLDKAHGESTTMPRGAPPALATPSPPAADPYAPDPNKLKMFNAAFAAPITFYGKVVDQNGDPVQQASVQIAANDVAWGNGSKYTKQTDANGLFSISNLMGLSIYVEASKAGYYRQPEHGGRLGSYGGFAYGGNLGHGIHHPDRDAPVVFTLFKQGVLEPLVKVGEKSFRLARDGTPRIVSLDSQQQGTQHNVIVKCSMGSEPPSGSDRRYNWHYEITVQRGGLQLRNDSFVFVAPDKGYLPSDGLTMPATLPDSQWQDTLERSYFVKFEDEVFARMDVRMITGGDHFVVIKSYLNPKPGSRNLEADPKRR